MRRHALLKHSPDEALLELLLVLSLGLQVLAVCPSVCSCTRSHREVDCSRRGLRQLPEGLQHNTRSLNLSHNRLHALDGRLTTYTHLRVLDLSHNRLSHLPQGLPRSLWHLHASSNRLQLLDKNDTVHQWNLRTLDLSNNKLERAVFINNTLINLCTLNLSRNHFWTLPTNLPARLETVDVSHNLLMRVLPGSLDRLHKVTNFYLHANRFSTLPYGVFDNMASLRVITLGDNPWSCHLYDEVSYLLSWTQQTPARVLGCPCHTRPVCGGVRHGPERAGGWHFASYNLPPLSANAQDLSSVPPSVTGWWYLSVSGQLSTAHSPEETADTQENPYLKSMPTHVHQTIDQRSAHTDSSLHTYVISSFSDTGLVTETGTMGETTPATDRFFTTESSSSQTKKTATLRTRSVRRQNKSVPNSIGNSSPTLASSTVLAFLYSIGLPSLHLQVL